MSRLSTDKIKEELATKHFTLLDDSNYTTLNSPIVIQCEHGHKIEVSMNDFRRPSFVCPCCDKSINFINPKNVPPKTGYRVIAFDQATEHFGLSIWDDSKLVFYSLYTFTGDVISRLTKIKSFINDIVIAAWKPDFIIMEDIQQQYGAVLTYKILAMLLGVIEVTCTENKVPYEVVSPNVWRKYAGTCGKNRKEEKMLSVAVVKNKYNINVSDDVAEAILIGQYGSRVHKKDYSIAFGKK